MVSNLRCTLVPGHREGCRATLRFCRRAGGYTAKVYEWSDLRFFLAVHREGSLAAAGRSLRVNPTTVGRRIAAMEEQLRTKLFVRSSRGWTATPAGLRVVPAAERAEEAAQDVQRLAGGGTEIPAGRVRISTIELLASQVIAPALPELHEAYPEIRVDVICSPERVDLGRGQADIAVRVGRPTEAGLIARRLASSQARPYAARSYLEAKGLAPDLETMEGLDVLVVFLPHRWLDAAGTVRIALRSNELSVVVAACCAGLGIALLPDVVAATHPHLVPLHGLGEVHEDSIWLVMQRDLAEVARVRAVADFLVETVGSMSSGPG